MAVADGSRRSERPVCPSCSHPVLCSVSLQPRPPPTTGYTLSELVTHLFPSLPETVVQQYVGMELSQNRYRRLKAGFDQLAVNSEDGVLTVQVRTGGALDGMVCSERAA